jgi:hypothetical protein
MLTRLIVWFACFVLAGGAASAVTVKEHPEGGWEATGKTYSARVDATGRLASLRMGDVELLGTDPKSGVVGAPFPGDQPATSVNLRQHLLAIRNDQVRLEYAFDDTGVNVETEGAGWAGILGAPVRVFVAADGGVRPGSTRSLGNVRRFIIGDSALEMSEPFHYIQGRLVPSAYPGNQKKPADPFSFRIELGLSADATALIEVRAFDAPADHRALAPQIPAGQKPRYEMELANLGTSDRTISLSYTLGTHYVGGAQSQPVALHTVPVAAGQTTTTHFEVDVREPGLHWLNVDVAVDGKTLKRERRCFIYAPDEYKPPLTRPDDFDAFWRDQLTRLRAEPMDAQLREDPARSTETAVFYSLDLNIRGQRYAVPMSVPRASGRYLAMFSSKIGEKASDAGRIIIANPKWPEQATFNRWAGADDNNLLDCILVAVRLTDYLRSREDVSGIYLSGGSRQGPIQLVNAAVDPTRIVGVDAHVPTSMGVSWGNYAYKGWGAVPNPPAMAAYVDPVNHAPQFKVPYIIDLGAYDGLSPAPGGLAFHNYATQAPFRRFSVELGGHGYFTSPFKRAAKAELEALINQRTDSEVDERIMKDH